MDYGEREGLFERKCGWWMMVEVVERDWMDD